MKNFSLNCRGSLLDLSKPKIMGILNITPDSFSDGGKFFSTDIALLHAEQLVEDGAEILDIGAQSTRPNAVKISAQEEIERLGSLISDIKKQFPQTLISLDTFYSDVVEFGANEGIDMINDISGGQFDSEMFSAVAKTRLPYILMHINAHYSTMHEKQISTDITLEENKYFSAKINELLNLGIYDIVLDPGFGFGKTVEQNHQLLDELGFLSFGQYPVLVGISRKSFIYKPAGKSALDIDEETQKLHLKALHNGANILRVHDVTSAKRSVETYLHQLDKN